MNIRMIFVPLFTYGLNVVSILYLFTGFPHIIYTEISVLSFILKKSNFKMSENTFRF